jgi:hypothetical protein
MLILRPGNAVHRAGFNGFLNFINIGAARVYHQSKTQRFVHPENLGANLLAGSTADAGFLIKHWYFLSHTVLLLDLGENELRAFSQQPPLSIYVKRRMQLA